jgi:hypothetical protein
MGKTCIKLPLQIRLLERATRFELATSCLEGKSSTTELHPLGPTQQQFPLCFFVAWWRGKDSNLRRQSRQIYSLIPLTAREPLQRNRELWSTHSVLSMGCIALSLCRLWQVVHRRKIGQIRYSGSCTAQFRPYSTLTTDSTIPPLRAAVIAQILGGLIAAGLLALFYPKLLQVPIAVAGTQALCAAFTARKLEAPPWWLAIHLGFMPLVVIASGLGVHPGWYLAAFVLLLLIFWRTDQSRVPLYLSNRKTALALAALLPPQPCRAVDLGCGSGALLRTLARLRPDCQFLGIEHAPLPWLWARLGCLAFVNCQIRHGNFWHQSLQEFDVVYAFLSPTPMPRLWAKAGVEMAAGSLLVSNSFAIPDTAPAATVQVADSRATRLFCYRPGA